MRSVRTTITLVATASAAPLLAATFAVRANAALEVRLSEGARYASDLTRAYEACVMPNTVSDDGVPACDPPVTSACDYSDGTVEIKASGQSPPDVHVKIKVSDVSGPGTCTTGTYQVGLFVRMTVDDAACISGQCTIIDAPVVAPGPVQGSNDVVAEFDIEEHLETSIGVTVGHVANYEVLEVYVIAPDGWPIAAAGVGNHGARSFKSDVTVPYAVCDIPDTSTTSAVPACREPSWTASCDYTDGEIQLTDLGDALPSVPVVAAQFGSVYGVGGACTDGTYEVAARVRLTGAACDGSPCTLVDTVAVIGVDADAGTIEDSASLATAGLTGPFDSIEVLDTFVRNPFTELIGSVGVTNSYRIDKPSVKVQVVDSLSVTDDRISIKGKLPQEPIDPTVDGATFTVTDREGVVYTVTIPGPSWETVGPRSWRYLNDVGVLAGVRKASIKATAGGWKFNLKARDIDLSEADQRGVNVLVTVSNTGSGVSITQRNAPCTLNAKGAKCKL